MTPTKGTMTTMDARRTIAVTTRRNGRLSRLRIEYPQWMREPDRRPAYDLDLVRLLLTLTSELPGSKRALLVLLAEYRHALLGLAAQIESAARADRCPGPVTASVSRQRAAVTAP